MNRTVTKLLKIVSILLIISLQLSCAASHKAGDANLDTEQIERHKPHKYWGLAMGAKAMGLAPGMFENILWEFDKVLAARTIKSPDKPFKFGQRPNDLKLTYVYEGTTYTIEEYLKRTKTTGFLVLKGDDIVYERYLRGANEKSLFTSFSAAKSFVSALVGIAIEEGLIKSVDDPITDYVPELKGTGYDGVPIKHILQMSSGVRFGGSWGYFNPFSGLWWLHERVMLLGLPMENYMLSREYGRPSGKKFDYQPIDTLALGMLLKQITGKTASALMEEKIWKPLGMESDAYWSMDSAGVELCYGYLNATLRDYGKFGRLYGNKGNWNGKQIVPESWVIESTTPVSPHMLPNRPENGGWGYQYQWWVPPDSDGEFMAWGHFGQKIYVYPKKNVVIVKTGVHVRSHSKESIMVFRAIADYLQ